MTMMHTICTQFFELFKRVGNRTFSHDAAKGVEVFLVEGKGSGRVLGHDFFVTRSRVSEFIWLPVYGRFII